MQSPEVPPVPKYWDSEKPFVIYINATEMGITPWDIRIKLMEHVDSEGITPIVKKHGAIVMSPVHAKVMLAALAQTVSNYEEKFGEIDLTKVNEAIKASLSPL